MDIDDWFLENLPEPPFYADGNSIGAVTWFEEPGRVVYEDAHQVVVPAVRKPQTAMPTDLALGPTTAGSKRHLPCENVAAKNF